MSMEIKIRDKRNKGWFYLDNEYLNGYAKIFGGIGTAIYVSLCRHADAEQKCFPSQELIGEELNIAPRTVRKYIKMFEDWNLLHVDRKKTSDGRWLNNIYYLLDKSEWKKPEAPVAHGHQRQMTTKPEENNSKNQRHQLPNKDTHTKNTHIEEYTGTPSQKARAFFEDGAWQMDALAFFVNHGADEKTIEREIKKFISYWTEPNKSGTKVRWELQKTFDVKRRLARWMTNAAEFAGRNKRERKGVVV